MNSLLFDERVQVRTVITRTTPSFTLDKCTTALQTLTDVCKQPLVKTPVVIVSLSKARRHYLWRVVSFD